MPQDTLPHVIRDLEQVALEMQAALACPVERYSYADFLNIADYSEADLKLTLADWARCKDHIYLNGTPLLTILHQLRMQTVLQVIEQYMQPQLVLAETQAREGAFHAVYAMAQLLEGVDTRHAAYTILELQEPTKLSTFIQTFSQHAAIFALLGEKNAVYLEFIELLHQHISLFFNTSADHHEVILSAVWERLMRDYLFAGEAALVQDAFINLLTTYAHQGGMMSPATYILQDSCARVNALKKTNSKWNIQEGFSAYATFELNFDAVNKCLTIRDKTQQLSATINQSSAPLMRATDGLEQEVNLIEFDITQRASYQVGKPLELHIINAEAYTTAATWNKLTSDIRLMWEINAALPTLRSYAELYLSKGHDSAMAAHIVTAFPFINSVPPIKLLGFLSTSTQSANNKADKLFAAYGRLNADFGVSIRKNMAKYLRLGEDAFVHAMKLMYRLGMENSLVNLLRTFTDTQADIAHLTKEKSLRILYPAFLEGYLEKVELNENFTRLMEKETFMQIGLLLQAHNKTAELSAVVHHYAELGVVDVSGRGGAYAIL